jgi:hypothetical protein
MSIFARPHYTDATQFIEQLKTAKPELDAQQIGPRPAGDREQDRDAQAGYREARVAQNPTSTRPASEPAMA